MDVESIESTDGLRGMGGGFENGAKMRLTRFSMVSFLVVLLLMAGTLHASGVIDQGNLMQVREAVWRAWFADDVPTLKRLVPADVITISAGEKEWKHQAGVFSVSCGWRKAGSDCVSAHGDAAVWKCGDPVYDL
jgi:hypothetical protein